MSNDVALGQLGSGFHDTHSVTLTPPTGKVIIAITFLEDVELDVLTPELHTDATFRGPVDSGDGQGGAGTFGGTISAPVTEGGRVKYKKGGAVKKKKKQGYNSRLDESLGMRNKGKKKQSMKSRRDESKGMKKSKGKKAYSANRSSAQGKKK